MADGYAPFKMQESPRGAQGDRTTKRNMISWVGSGNRKRHSQKNKIQITHEM